MSFNQGQLPQAERRIRRNAQRFVQDNVFVVGNGIGTDSNGALTIQAADASISVAAAGIGVVTTGVLTVGGSGVEVTIGDGLENDGGSLAMIRSDANDDIVFQSYDDAGRPAFGTAGRVIFNTTDGNLNIDDGTQWILPDGTTT